MSEEDEHFLASSTTLKKNVAPLRKPVECPNCGHKSNRELYPFCSKRCQDVDLNRWFSGSYAIPVAEDDHGFNEDS